jgi:hypothetical protein
MSNAIHHMKFFAAMVFSLIVLTIILGCNPQPEQNIQQPPPEIRMGYCPTMHPYVQSLAESHQNVIPVLYDNSAAAMQALQAGTVQAILIGRTAWAHELIADLRLLLMDDGLTLIVQQPGVICYEDVPKIRILTHEDPTAVQSLIPIHTNVVFYDDFEQMISDMDASAAVLLRWSQVSPTDNLLIPVDPSGLKTPDFRSPHLYYMAPMEETLSTLLTTLATNP